MVTELVLFDLPEGMTREELVAKYRRTAPAWRENSDLIRKTYVFDPDQRQGGGVYLWRDISAAKRGHDEAWRRRVVELYGNEPIIRYFDTPLVVDNELGRTIDDAAADAPIAS